MSGKDFFNAIAPSGNLADRKGLTIPPILDGNYHALKNLDAFLITFYNFLVNPDSVATADGLVLIGKVL